jgi:alpha-amylase
VYDAYERRSGLVRVLSAAASAADWAAARAEELGDVVDGAFGVVDLGQGRLVARRESTITGQPVTVTKTLILGGDRRSPTLELGLELEHRGDAAIDARLGTEWSLTMLGGGGNPSAWWEREDGSRTGHDQSGEASGIRTIAQGNDYIGIAVRTTLDEPTDAWFAPIETISNSEDGYERVYQGSGLLVSWPLHLEPGQRWSRIVRHTVTTTRDRRDEAP